MRKVMVIVARALVGLGGAATGVGRIVLERQIASEIDALLANARPPAPATVSEADLEPLPQPVRRWLRHARVVGKQRPTTVRLRQAGRFQMESRGWLPYQDEQYFTNQPPGFLWKASFRIGPARLGRRPRPAPPRPGQHPHAGTVACSGRQQDRRRPQPG